MYCPNITSQESHSELFNYFIYYLFWINNVYYCAQHDLCTVLLCLLRSITYLGSRDSRVLRFHSFKDVWLIVRRVFISALPHQCCTKNMQSSAFINFVSTSVKLLCPAKFSYYILFKSTSTIFMWSFSTCISEFTNFCAFHLIYEAHVVLSILYLWLYIVINTANHGYIIKMCTQYNILSSFTWLIGYYYIFYHHFNIVF